MYSQGPVFQALSGPGMNPPDKDTPPTKWKKIAKATTCSHLCTCVIEVLAAVMEVVSLPVEGASHAIQRSSLKQIALQY